MAQVFLFQLFFHFVCFPFVNCESNPDNNNNSNIPVCITNCTNSVVVLSRMSDNKIGRMYLITIFDRIISLVKIKPTNNQK